MIFETHAHYDDEAFNEDRDSVLLSLKNRGIETVVNVGASITTSKSTLKLADEYEFVYAAVGVHPSETKELNEENFSWLSEQLKNKKVLAVGEIGLDYYWDTPEREVQKVWFEKQLKLAIDHELPVIIHSRDAAADTLVMMKEAKEYAKKNNKPFTGVIHCFSYAVEMAKEYIAMGFFLGIGGVVTFKNAKTIKEVVEYAPLENLVLETDCPYLTPVPHRGTRNDSSYLTLVAQEIAAIKQIPYEEVVKATADNAKRLYGIQQ